MKNRVPRIRLSAEEFDLIQKRRKNLEAGKSFLSPFADKVHTAIKKSSETLTIEKLANRFDVSPKTIETTLQELRFNGYNVEIQNARVLFSTIIPKRPDLVIERGREGVIRFGACGDNHLGSKYERLDVLHALYDRFADEGIDTVYNTGNWIDGEARFNKHDLHTHGLENQIEYLLEYYPHRPGIETRYIGGDDHEGWYTQREGIDIGLYLEMKAKAGGRNDLRYLGYMEHDVIFKAPAGETRLRVTHPGGGSAYAISYTMQKLVESLQEGEKPHIILAGHYHKQGYNEIRGVHTIQTGCTQDQTPFMRKKKISAHVGGWIIEVKTDERGAITSFKSEWIKFYNRKYYSGWKYQTGDLKAKSL